jgi:hypothetical protein
LDNLLASLLGHAPKRGEDALTATFAWLLRHHTNLRVAFVDALRGGDEARFPAEMPRVRVQVPEEASRYDLVLAWDGVRAVIEVKVDAALGWRSIADDTTGELLVVSQVTKYLHTGNREGRPPTWVFTLAPDAIVVEAAAAKHARYGGSLRWHDVRRMLESSAGEDPVVSQVAGWFVDVLKRRGMTYEKLTESALQAVGPYLTFKRTIDAMIDRAFDVLKAEGAFVELAVQEPWRQEAYQRIGWVLPVNKAKGHNAFIGVSVSPQATADGAPDLLFFLETPPTKEAARRIHSERAAWEEGLVALRAESAANWHLGEGWPVLRATLDLRTLLDAEDQTAAATAFFRECLAAAKRHGLIARYLAATK